jgi:hypothetical protein
LAALEWATILLWLEESQWQQSKSRLTSGERKSLLQRTRCLGTKSP